MKRLCPALFLMLLALSPRPGGAAIMVTIDNDEKTANNGACSLREAVQTAQDYSSGGIQFFFPECKTKNGGQDVIEFKEKLGTIELTPLPNADNAIFLSSNLTIQGAAADDLQEISGAGGTRIFRIGGEFTVTLKNLRLTKGFLEDEGSSGSGAALLVDGGSATVTIDSCWFAGNDAGRGGAISFHGWKLFVLNSAFDANKSFTDGGAIEAGGQVTIEDTAFDSNSARQGGGAVACDGSGSKLTILRSSFSLNTAAGKKATIASGVPGGGAVMSGCEIDIQDTLFRLNFVYGEIPTSEDPDTAKNGGGGGLFLTSSGFGKVARSVFKLNQAGLGPDEIGSGGAIYANGNLVVDRCAIEENSAAGGHGGGGITFRNSYSLVVNTILRDNTSRVDDWEWPGKDPNTAPAPGGAIAAVGLGAVAITNSSLVANSGTSELFVSGTVGLSLKNSLIGAFLAKASCEGNPVSNGGFNVEDATSGACGFPQDLTGGTYLPHTFPVKVPGDFDLGFTYFLPTFTAPPAGNGDQTTCTDPPVAGVDLLGHPRIEPCTIGAIELP